MKKNESKLTPAGCSDHGHKHHNSGGCGDSCSKYIIDDFVCFGGTGPVKKFWENKRKTCYRLEVGDYVGISLKGQCCRYVGCVCECCKLNGEWQVVLYIDQTFIPEEFRDNLAPDLSVVRIKSSEIAAVIYYPQRQRCST